MFALLLVSCGVSGCSGAGADLAYVTGSVLESPSCPVQLPESPCPPPPVEGVVVQLLRGDSVVADGRTDARGAFRLSAPPGAYVVRTTVADGYHSEASRPVELTAGGTVSVTLLLDTGIR